MNQQASLFEQPAPQIDSEELSLAAFAERAYLDYAISVVKGRALPDVTDGQKPVQRRILYAMNELGLSANAKPRKSAAVVGDVLGKFHPHGDQSVYDALVRMAQNFTLRYPLIDGQGNFGSRDGDGAAAMRYTEARLTPIASMLLDEIDADTVDFQANYDGAFQEPKLLPSRLPMILLNGSSGIAVGMATEIPPHNLTEVANAAIAIIRNPELPHEDLMAIMPGPDFPGGGQIITPTPAIGEMYAHGRGTMKVRARWKIEELARGQWQLVVTELPPDTSAQKVLEEIEELTNPKIKAGKKTLSPEQLSQKQIILSLLDSVRDESGRDAPVRLVFEPRSRNQDPAEFAQQLLANTSLECNASLNMVVIGTDGKPRQKPLGEILKEWVAFRIDTVTRRTRFRLNKVDERIHILEGREAVLLNIDRVIRLIRNSEEPKPALMKAFRLTERQADDILEIRLRQLAKLEAVRIEQELKQLRHEKNLLHDLLDMPHAMRESVVREIEADRDRFGDARRTLIEEAQRAAIEQKVLDEPVTVVVSQRGWVRTRAGHGHEAKQFSFKSGDALYGTFECRTIDHLLAFGASGRVYSVSVAALPGARGDGVPVTTLIEPASGEPILHYFAGPPEASLLVATSHGYGFAAKSGDMLSRLRGGKSFVTMEDGELLLPPHVIGANDSAIACLSQNGRLLLFALTEIRTLTNGGRGVILMGLDGGETLTAAQPVSDKGMIAIGKSRNGKEQESRFTATALAAFAGKRARKGKKLNLKFSVERIHPIL